MTLTEEIKMTKFESEYQKAILNIIFTGYWLEERTSDVLKPFGLSEQQFNVLRILRGQKGNAINLCDVQCRMMHKMSNATRLVEKLRLKGLVERVPTPDNRRMVDITINQKGMDLLAEIDAVMVNYQDTYRNKLSDNELKILSDLLEKLRD